MWFKFWDIFCYSYCLSLTVTVIVSLYSRGSALTTTSKIYRPAWEFVGVHEKTPVYLLIDASLGYLSNGYSSFLI